MCVVQSVGEQASLEKQSLRLGGCSFQASSCPIAAIIQSQAPDSESQSFLKVSKMPSPFRTPGGVRFPTTLGPGAPFIVPFPAGVTGLWVVLPSEGLCLLNCGKSQRFGCGEVYWISSINSAVFCIFDLPGRVLETHRPNKERFLEDIGYKLVYLLGTDFGHKCALALSFKGTWIFGVVDAHNRNLPCIYAAVLSLRWLPAYWAPCGETMLSPWRS